MRFGFLAVLMAAALLATSCWGGGGRYLWETPPGAGWLPLVEWSWTGMIDLTMDGDGNSYYHGSDSIGVEDDSSGAAAILPNDTYVTTNGMSPTWINFGVGPLDTAPANASYPGYYKIGGCQVTVDTSLGSFGTVFSKNLTIVLPLYRQFTAGGGVTVFMWDGDSWERFAGASQFNETVDTGGWTVTIRYNRGGQFMVGLPSTHAQGTGGTQ
ncbi:MAG: hypothetical protein HRF49_09400 [bacterium]|jgi:hypothetical protein